jgi:flagellar assembly protein FliH
MVYEPVHPDRALAIVEGDDSPRDYAFRPVSGQLAASPVSGQLAASPVSGRAAERTPTAWLANFAVNPGVPERLVEEARAEARSAGYLTGWGQGMRDATERMAAEAHEVHRRTEQIEADRIAAITRGLRAIDAAAAELEQRAVPTLEHLEETVIEMAVTIAQAVLGHELRRRSDRVIIQAMARILVLVPANEPVTVRLSPQDHESLSVADVVNSFASTRVISIVAAPELEPGDVVASSGATEIDGRIGPALDRIRAILGTEPDRRSGDRP